MMSLSPHKVAIDVQHSKKRTNVRFKGTLPVLDSKEAPHDIFLNGPCGIVSEDSSEYLFSVGSFGIKIAEDALEQYIQIQKAIALGEDISTKDLFFLLDSVRRSRRQRGDDDDDDEADVTEPAEPDSDQPDLSPGSENDQADLSPSAALASSPEWDAGEDEDGWGRSKDGDREEKQVRRRLVLQPEEVLFLSHALGCARVTTADGTELSGERLYRHLSADCGDRHLAARYAAYLELRGRGWVVRDGILSGADFVLYRRGPAFYHAALVVTVQVMSAETGRLLPERNWRQADWLYAAGLCRAAEQTAKDVLLVRLLWPSDLGQPADLSYLRRVAVQHTLVRRWTPGRTGRDTGS